jgi:tetratricopeptide (TPR) repeat protein
VLSAVINNQALNAVWVARAEDGKINGEAFIRDMRSIGAMQSLSATDVLATAVDDEGRQSLLRIRFEPGNWKTNCHDAAPYLAMFFAREGELYASQVQTQYMLDEKPRYESLIGMLGTWMPGRSDQENESDVENNKYLIDRFKKDAKKYSREAEQMTAVDKRLDSDYLLKRALQWMLFARDETKVGEVSPSLTGYVLLDLGEARLVTFDLAGAEADIKRGVQLVESPPADLAVRAFAHEALADVKQFKGDDADATRLFRQAMLELGERATAELKTLKETFDQAAAKENIDAPSYTEFSDLALYLRIAKKLSDILVDHDRLEEAQTVLSSAIAKLETEVGSEAEELLGIQLEIDLPRIMMRVGKTAEAERAIDHLAALLSRSDIPIFRLALLRLQVDQASTQGRDRDVIPLADTFVEEAENFYGTGSVTATLASSGVQAAEAKSLANLNELREAEVLLRRSEEAARKAIGAEHPALVELHAELGAVLLKQGACAGVVRIFPKGGGHPGSYR